MRFAAFVVACFWLFQVTGRKPKFSAEYNRQTAPLRGAAASAALPANAASFLRRPGLEPGTCGLTVRPVIAWKAAPVNDLDQSAGNIFGWFPEFSRLKDYTAPVMRRCDRVAILLEDARTLRQRCS
jgi:hypothetical protein